MSDASRKNEGRSSTGSRVIGSLFSAATSLFFLAVLVASIHNVFGIGSEVEQLAKEKACQGKPLPCVAQYTQQLRTPWAHNFLHMYTSSSSREGSVTCKRQYILIGEWSCQHNGGAAEPLPSSTPSAVVSAIPVSNGTKRQVAMPRSSSPATRQATTNPAANPGASSTP